MKKPDFVNEIVYADKKFKLTRKWKWDVKGVFVDDETGLFKTLISGDAFNGKSGISAYFQRWNGCII